MAATRPRALLPMQRLKQRADFLAAAKGSRVSASAFVLQARKRTDDGPVRFGFTVSRKVGNAVERNRVRRRLREIVRLSDAKRMRRGHDYVLIGRRAALELPFARMAQDFEGALRALMWDDNNGSAMTDKKNTILAIVLSAIVLIAWQFFVGMPQQEKARQEQLAQQQSSSRRNPAPNRASPASRRRAAGAARDGRAGAGPSRSSRGGARPGRRAARARASRDARGGAQSLRAHPDRHPQPARLDRAQGRPHRRPGADQIPRDRRPEVAADRAAVAVGQPRPVLCRVRLDRRSRHAT